jgi:hypothetical protein
MKDNQINIAVCTAEHFLSQKEKNNFFSMKLVKGWNNNFNPE